MEKKIAIQNVSGMGLVVSVEEKDYELACKRLDALKDMWDKNSIQLVNNDHPIYTRDYSIITLLNVYLKHSYKEKYTINIDYDNSGEDLKADKVYIFKYAREYHFDE